MAYTYTNFKTKKALREAVAARQDFLKRQAIARSLGTELRDPVVKAVTAFQPGPFGPDLPRDGQITLEGPHYPKPHRWYAVAELRNGEITKVR